MQLESNKPFRHERYLDLYGLKKCSNCGHVWQRKRLYKPKCPFCGSFQVRIYTETEVSNAIDIIDESWSLERSRSIHLFYKINHLGGAIDSVSGLRRITPLRTDPLNGDNWIVSVDVWIYCKRSSSHHIGRTDTILRDVTKQIMDENLFTDVTSLSLFGHWIFTSEYGNPENDGIEVEINVRRE